MRELHRGVVNRPARAGGPWNGPDSVAALSPREPGVKNAGPITARRTRAVNDPEDEKRLPTPFFPYFRRRQPYANRLTAPMPRSKSVEGSGIEWSSPISDAERARL